ncbi:MAG TPA: DUF3783 domain-containing protein [Candidatus Blautia faecigallinarum]|uniref:DUF3783 domain-containing protein n=1 Tax=Candidatus Blautia faecigallinarum TaxID=2838488 RepID=A0A9D2DUA9_9FIRM|nr:DUF3783 domain-containing protein [Candidatus Blautia faecigallinarum]
MNTPLVLLYNFQHEPRTRQIRRYLSSQGIAVSITEPAEYWQPLGFLAGLPGFQKDESFHLGGNFSEEMMVLCGLSPKQTDDFLQFFKTASLAPVDLKAVLTPVNRHWNSLQLREELMREHKELSAK